MDNYEYIDILNTVIDNGRVETDGRGGWDKDSLEVEVRFEANERGIDADSAVKFALSHTK